ncbi:acyl-[acyl-carrier-protein] thioesterase [Nocardia otitidiscaviarum]|uniref:acyl-[acyl-carrier-protein] thioesterase n=1 Tax=Nocardia otitidiscaviarum TaxID=1823 RepID=UPI0005BDCA75|nr:acyl-ACP thioesterase domain-containing protein [Nocardia otitidiscaviarum]
MPTETAYRTEQPVIDFPLPPRPDGEAYEASWAVRLADTDTRERLRLDGIARYAMDIGYDQLRAAEDGHLHPAWLVRRTVIDVLRPIRFGDRVRLRRWPSALSNRWFNARIQIHSDQGGVVEVEQFLINVDPQAGRPARMTDRFMSPMLAVTTEHRLRWKAALHEQTTPAADARPFPLRATDFDRHDHVNNAVHWQAVEETLTAHPDLHARPHRAIVEHVGPVMAGNDVTLRSWRTDTGLHAQLEIDGTARTLAIVTPLD